MTHRVLALKYRPQVFSDLVGQDHVSTVLSRALEGGRAAQAYLFAGARGVGKTTSARILAKALNCENRSGAEPCNACNSCREITAGVSLDVSEIDGASNRGIADVQALREKVRFTPSGGRHRVVIVDEVHQLSNDAFAALLKTLEEPPPHLVFVFATTDPQKLPDTIRSRTQRFDFARVPFRKVADRLREIARREAEDPEGLRFSLDEGAALLIAQKSEGSIRDAVSALDQVVSSGEPQVNEDLVRRVLGIADREAFFGLVESIVARDPKGALGALHQAFEKGIDPMELAQGLSEHIRHLLVLKVDPGADQLVPATAEELKRLRAQAAAWSEHDLMRLMKLVSDLSWPMRDSAQPLIHLEAAVLQMATLEPGATLRELVDRLESLERRLAGGGSGAAEGVALAGVDPARSSGEPASRPTPGSPAAPEAARVSGAGTPPRSAGSPEAVGVRGPATAVLDEDDPPRLDPQTRMMWEAVVEAVNGKKRMLGAFLQESRFLGASRGWIRLGLTELHRSVVDERENRSLVEEHAAAVFGRPLRLRCEVEAAGRERPAGGEEFRPLVERAIAWFEGEVIPDRPGERSDR